MAQLPSNESTFSGIDAASKINNNNSCINTDDIIGTFVTLSTTVTLSSAETLTALNFSPPLSPSTHHQSISNANLPSIKTGRGITHRTSEFYHHSVPALADSYIRTGRE
uniref:Uncharacterized protein n=1 Tax=Panagrolaimus sp. PS1159 TaxID=55785 RepID=A0AC35GVG9_9BILA